MKVKFLEFKKTVKSKKKWAWRPHLKHKKTKDIYLSVQLKMKGKKILSIILWGSSLNHKYLFKAGENFTVWEGPNCVGKIVIL